MSNSLEFKRKFFILKGNYSNMRHLNPKGHGKLELRNNRIKFSINIENAEADSYYQIILLGDDGIYDLGKLFTDNKHSGKVEFDLNYKEFESAGFPVEKINGIILIRDSNLLLGGYMEKDDKSIENYLAKISRIDKKEEKEEFVEEVRQDNHPPENYYPADILDKAIEGEEEVQYIKNDLNMETNYYQDLVDQETIDDQDFNQEAYEEANIEKIEDEPIPREEIDSRDSQEGGFGEEYDKAMQEVFHDYQDQPQIEESEYFIAEEKRKQNQRDQTTNYVLNILRFFPFVEPFKIDLKGYNWWRIDIDDPREDKGFLPYFSYVAGGNHKYPLVQNSVTATELIRKNKHYLFGLYNSNEEVKFYVYGVPGEFTADDHPQRGTTGFNTWFEGQEYLGYWLIYIDPITGRIIYPINPMIPKD